MHLQIQYTYTLYTMEMTQTFKHAQTYTDLATIAEGLCLSYYQNSLLILNGGFL